MLASEAFAALQIQPSEPAGLRSLKDASPKHVHSLVHARLRTMRHLAANHANAEALSRIMAQHYQALQVHAGESETTAALLEQRFEGVAAFPLVSACLPMEDNSNNGADACVPHVQMQLQSTSVSISAPPHILRQLQDSSGSDEALHVRGFMLPGTNSNAPEG